MFQEDQMNTRRTFIKEAALLWGALIIAPVLKVWAKMPFRFNKKGRPLKHILVLWYSQTGHTRRIGQLLARVCQNLNLQVTSSDIRDVNPLDADKDEFLIIGSPVFYYDTPPYVKEWIESAPDLAGRPVASFVTFGGPEGDQHNAASNILKHLSRKGGVPVGLNTFLNMGTFPLSWDAAGVQAHKHLPNEETFEKARKYARTLIQRIQEGAIYEVDKKITLRRVSTGFNPRFWTKFAIENHTIDKAECIHCGTCLEKCPTDAIDLEAYTVDTDTCILCFGCINNCPAQAVVMEYKGERVYGFKEFLKRNNIIIKEPRELQA